ncbi:tetratricopeptide repeat protein [Lentisphaerota bacterium WC36G]|nr:sel1 repeat family protein [Lentisphaerae bacterium WC36]
MFKNIVFLIIFTLFGIFFCSCSNKSKNKVNQNLKDVEKVSFLTINYSDKEYVKLVKEFSSKANSGDTFYMLLLGKMAMNLRNDYDSAAKWFEKAIEHDDPDGYEGLGLLTKAVTQHLLKNKKIINEMQLSSLKNQAIEYYKKGMNEGSIKSKIALATSYILMGYKEPGELLYREACATGNIDALIAYGDYHAKYKEEYKNAMIYYKKAADQNSVSAMLKIAQLLSTQNKDHNQSIAWLQKAVKQKSTLAIYKIISVYYNDLKDLDKALEWCLYGVNMDSKPSYYSLVYLITKKENDNELISFFNSKVKSPEYKKIKAIRDAFKELEDDKNTKYWESKLKQSEKILKNRYSH